MKTSPVRGRVADSVELTPQQETAVKAAGAWVNQLARTLKTCRLYDARNPTVLRFRQELATALQRFLDDHGALVLQFSADDVKYEGVSLYAARSREDNLALPFFRDGLRRLTFSSGIRPEELDALLDAVLLVTSQTPGEDDLITLLWQAHLTCVNVDYVPGCSDLGSGDGHSAGGRSEEGELVPWPTPLGDLGAGETGPDLRIGGGEGDDAAVGGKEGAVGPDGESLARLVQGEVATTASAAFSKGGLEAEVRSDDWNLGAVTDEIEATFEELETIAPFELRRFQREFEAERQISTVAAAIGIARAYLAAEAGTEDRAELARFLPRVLRLALVQGAWSDASQVLTLLDECQSSEWSLGAFAQELQQPISVSGIRERMEQQDPEAVGELIAFVNRLGEPAVDLLNLLLSETQDATRQRSLTRAVIEKCRSNPERLAPWLADPRPSMVRNVVKILGLIGGGAIVGLLQAVVAHPDPAVRFEIVTALGRVDTKLARPLLLAMLERADSRLFCTVLRELSRTRDATAARRLVGFLTDPDLEKRPIEERRAIYSAVSAACGDEVIPELEAELLKGNWFSRVHEEHRRAVARCIARVGTGLATMVLERGAQSRRAPVRKACEEALGRFVEGG